MLVENIINCSRIFLFADELGWALFHESLHALLAIGLLDEEAQ